MRTVVIGTGKIAQEYLGKKYIDLDCVIAFAESNVKKSSFCGKVVVPLVKVSELEFDFVIIAVKRAQELYRKCLQMGIDSNKIVVLFPQKYYYGLREVFPYKKIEKALTAEGYQRVCNNFGIVFDDWIDDDKAEYIKKNTRESFKVHERYDYYIYSDKEQNAGTVGSYFWQDLWAAKLIKANKPIKHFDIGSRIDGFISHILLLDIPVVQIDVRPLPYVIDGLSFICADATTLDNIGDESLESISALCSLEHFGLGRYGDPVDPEACFKCFEAICKKTKSGGNIYLSVPIGTEHLEFNAERVFYASTIVSAFRECDLMEYSCIKDDQIESNVDLHAYDGDLNLGGARFGLFWFKKK